MTRPASDPVCVLCHNTAEGSATADSPATPTVPTGADLQSLLAPLDDPRYDAARCAQIATLIGEITDLKRTQKAVVLAHNYQRPEIFKVADFVGDSLELARTATRVEAEVIVFCGVHFMAETAILTPRGRILLTAGLLVADSGRGRSRRAQGELRASTGPGGGRLLKPPRGEAECDVCCTSSNAVKVVEALRASNP